MDNTANYARDCTRSHLAQGQGRAGSGGHSLGFRVPAQGVVHGKGMFFTGSVCWPYASFSDQEALRGHACMHAQSLQPCPTLCDPIDCSPPGSSVHGDSLGKNTGVGCHALLQRILPTQGPNLGCPHCKRILYNLSHHETREYWSG